MNNYNPYKTQSLADYRHAGAGLSPIKGEESSQPWLDTLAEAVFALRATLQTAALKPEQEELVISAFVSAANALRYVQVERELAYESLYLQTAQAGYDAYARDAIVEDDPRVDAANKAYEVIVDHFCRAEYYDSSLCKKLRWLLGV